MGIFVKFGTEIKGSAKAKGHEGWIPCSNFGISAQRHIASGKSEQRNPSTPYISEITFSRESDIASGPIFGNVVGGSKEMGTCTVNVVQGASQTNAQVVIEIVLTAALIS